MGAREYDPRVGRWLQRDPIEVESGEVNLYAYAANDPLSYVDPTGEQRGRILRGIIDWVRNLFKRNKRATEEAREQVQQTRGQAPSSGQAKRPEKKVEEHKPDTGGAKRNSNEKAKKEVTGEELAKLRAEFEKIKPEFWKHEAKCNPDKYSPENLERMRRGKPPIGSDRKPMEVNHKVPLSEGGTNSFDNLEPLTKAEHIRRHSEAGDFKRWGGHAKKKKP